MGKQHKTKKELMDELEFMHQRVAELEKNRADYHPAERTIHQTNAQLNAIIQAFDGLMYVCSRDYRIEFMNQRLIERTGRDATGELCHKILHDLNSICPWCVNDRVFDGETVRWEVKSPKDDLWFYVVNTPIYNDDGKISKQALIMDITDRKRAEEALQKAYNELKKSMTLFGPEEDAFEVIGNCMQAGIYIIQDGKTIFTNSYISSYSGYSREELLNLSLMWNTVHPEDQAHVRECGIKMLRGEELAPYEYRILCKDGSIKWLMEKVTSIKYKGRRAVLGSTMDVTDKKRTEDELRDIKAKLEIRIQERTSALSAANEALKKSEEMLRLITDNMSDMIRVTDLQGVNVYVSPSHLKSLGYKQEERLGKAGLDIVHPDDARLVIKAFSASLVNKKPVKIEYRVKHAKGHYVWLETIGDMLRDDHGEVTAAVLSSRDISERKAVEEALYESQQLMHSIIQGSPIPAFVIDKNHRITYWNRALEELSGLRAKDMVGTSEQWRAFYSEKRPCMADVLVDADITAMNLLYPGKYIKSNLLDDAYEGTDFFPDIGGGRGKWIRFTAAVIKSSQGNTIGVIETLEDISERREAEVALISEHERLASILDGIPIPTFVIDRNHRVVLWNRHNEIYTGIAKKEVIGKPLDLNFLFPQKSSPALAELILEMSNEELVAKFDRRGLSKSEIQPHAFESTGLIWLKGEERTVSVQAARIFDFKGELVGAIQTGQDITEHMQLELQLRQAQKMQAIGTLAGGIAHDFNNILSAIMGYTDMALTDHKMDDRLRRYLEQVFKAGERARDLVKQILTFSRQSDEKPRPLRLGPVVREVLKLLRASLPSTIRIRHDIQSDPDMVLAHPTHIHQILMNLCSNAAHAMQEGKGELKVSLAPVEITPGDVLLIHHDLTPGVYIKLSVSDTGVGIAPGIINRIFDPFFTTKKPGEGTGMGLSVVHGIVVSYGGAITVQSKVGEGTEFNVYIPLLIEVRDKQEAKVEAPIPIGKERILFVDDEAALVELGKGMLSAMGYDVMGRTNSLDALEFFRTRSDDFDLVITDMTMPNMTGSELAQELMQIRPDIPVILCTGFSETITPEIAKVIGIKEFLMKPIVQRQMAIAIRRALDQTE
jgi:PAS domain S-box-containing protein